VGTGPIPGRGVLERYLPDLKTEVERLNLLKCKSCKGMDLIPKGWHQLGIGFVVGFVA
jgi:hypothetical protein